MKTINLFKSLVLSLGFLTLVSAQENEVTISVDTLSSDVYMLTGQGGNIGLYIGTHNVFMIDDQFARLSDKIKATIASLTDQPISFLFNTHMHGDHMGGNAKFNANGTTLVAHDNVRKSLEARLAKDSSLGSKILPEVSFSDDITFYDGDETIMAYHVHDAHTNGDALVYFVNNNVLHMGDTYFAGRYPYIDLNNGGSVDGLINSFQKTLLLINDETKIIPGHGRPSNKKELVTYISMLQDIRTKVQSEINAGKTLEEVKGNTDLLSAYDSTHGNGFINPERIREIFYSSLKK